MEILYIILGILVILIGYVIKTYNQLISNRNLVKEGWSGIDVQLKRRSNLIPNLVETVKGYKKHEEKVLNDITAARTACQKVPEGDVQQRSVAESILSRQIGTIFAVAEDYPELKANQNFIELHKSLDQIEEELQMARRYYNGTVRTLNNLVESFPSNIVAGYFKFQTAIFFEIDNPQDKALPKVEF